MAAGRIIKPIMKRAVTTASLVARSMTLGVRALAIDDLQRVVLVKHSYLPGWYLPGGGVEPGETVAEAVRRELREEANVVVDEPPPVFGIYLNRGASRRDHVAFFVVRSFEHWQPPKLPNLEIIDCQWFPLDALPEGVTPGTLRRIADYEAGKPLTQDW